MAKESWRNILVRAPNWVGDLVMATASLNDLRKSFPDARISILLRPSRKAVLAGARYYDELISESGRSLPSILGTAREVKARGFDLALIYPNSLRTALIPLLAGIPERIGYGGVGRRFLLTRSIEEPSWRRPLWKPGPRRFPLPMAKRYSALVEAAGGEPGDGRPVLAVSPECEARAEAMRRELGIAPGERLLGINPGASYGSSKLWPAERFARVGDLLSRKLGWRAIIFVGPGEEAIGERIADLMEEPAISTSKAPLDLDTLKPFIRDLGLLVTTDTGTRHYAVAFRVPVAVIMGPTHPGFTAANLDETEVLRRDVDCGPCHLKVCPTDHRCMTLIEPEEVAERARKLLERAGKSPR